jgi:cytochrome c2
VRGGRAATRRNATAAGRVLRRRPPLAARATGQQVCYEARAASSPARQSPKREEVRVKRLVLLAVLIGICGVALASTAFAQGKAEAGEKVYAAQKCTMCHSIAGKGNIKNPLDGVGSRLKADEIREWVTNPKEAAAKAKKTVFMKPYPNLPKEELDNLVAYLETLKAK